MRPIDADKLIRWLEVNRANLNPMDCQAEKETYSECIAIVGAMETIQVEPVRHGQWIHDINNLYACSECLERETMPPKRLKPYCPNCGAKMDGG